MRRVEKYKQLRSLRHKYIFITFLFITIITTGIFAADNSINGLVGQNKGLNIVSFKSNESYLGISIMNKELFVNTEYLNSDLKNIKKLISSFLGGR